MNSSLPVRRWVLGGGLIALGIFSGVGVLLLWSFGVFGSLLRVDAPGTKAAHLDPGNYAIYWESPLLAREESKPPYVPLELQSKEGGPVVLTFSDLFMPSRCYTLDNNHGALLAEFTIDRKTEYRVIVGAPKVKQEVPGRISITRGMSLPVFVRLCVVPFTLFWGGVGSGLFFLLRRPKAA